MTDLPTLHVHATREHYVRHMKPITAVLGERGVKIDPSRPLKDEFVLVGAGTDATDMAGRKAIYVEHGAGQSYDGDPEGPNYGKRGYPGGSGLDHVVLFICPNQSVADRWQKRYPGVRTAVVGCPALDRWHNDPPVLEEGLTRIAMTFHWPTAFSPESNTAWPEYQRYIAERLVVRCLYEGWSLVGHEHPRWGGNLVTTFQSMGIPTMSYDKVMETATLLMADNTSMIPEFASLGRPVLFLDSAAYRHEIDHGGRFWDWPKGQISCPDETQLVKSVLAALADGAEVAAARQRMVESAYAYTDGKASERAADAIMEVLAP